MESKKYILCSERQTFLSVEKYTKILIDKCFVCQFLSGVKQFGRATLPICSFIRLLGLETNCQISFQNDYNILYYFQQILRLEWQSLIILNFAYLPCNFANCAGRLSEILFSVSSTWTFIKNDIFLILKSILKS